MGRRDLPDMYTLACIWVKSDFIDPSYIWVKSGSDLDCYLGQWVIQVSSRDPASTLFYTLLESSMKFFAPFLHHESIDFSHLFQVLILKSSGHWFFYIDLPTWVCYSIFDHVLPNFVYCYNIKTHGSVSCGQVKRACTPHREYINRKNKNSIFTHA